MATTIVRPRTLGLVSAVRLAAVFAAVMLLAHIALNLWQTHTGWGIFRDEFYYLVCGRHLAWGYVDHGPLVALQARLAETLFGDSLTGIRMLSALAGSLRIALTGLFAFALGGRRPAQGLAMLAACFAPQPLALDGFLSMNSVEPIFWITCLLVLVLLVRGAGPRWWLLFGISAGLGLLNKPSMAFFLIALLAALLLTPRRRLLASRWCLAAIALLLLITAPYLLWQVHNHWPTWEFLHNGRIYGKNKVLGPVAFLLTQLLDQGPLLAFVWLPGLVFLLRRREHRWAGLTFVLFFVGMFAIHAKDYYLAPIYPLLVAAGGLAWQQRFARTPRVAHDRIFAFPIYESLIFLLGLAFVPMSIPVLAPATFVRYASFLHLGNGAATNSEVGSSGPLPQFYADRFYWQEEAAAVRRVYQSLSPAEQSQVVISTDNYGEAASLIVLAPELPPAVSGHNNFFLWGPGPRPGNIVILVETTTADHLHHYADSVQAAAHPTSPWAMPYENSRTIWLLRDLHKPLSQLWSDKKLYE